MSTVTRGMGTLNLLLLAPLAITGKPDAVPTQLKSHIVEASVFKSGLVMLTREVLVPAGNGFYCLDIVPQAYDGSFWYSSPDGMLVTDVETTLRTTDDTVKATAQTITEYIAANVGQSVKLTYRTPQGATPLKETFEQVEGIVSGPPRPSSNFMSIKLANGHLRSLVLSSIEEIDTKGLKNELSRTIKTPDLKVRFRAQPDKPSRLDFVTMETGATWVGSYFVKLKPAGAATVVGKAQVAVGRLNFEDTTVKAVAGQPYMVSNTKYDLNSGVGSLSHYLAGDQEQYLTYHPGGRDPYLSLPQMAAEGVQAAQWANGFGNQDDINSPYPRGGYYGGMGGGMGGGGGFYGANVAQGNIQFRKELAPQATTDRIESLFAYPMGKISLQAGDRISRILFSQNSTYENIFRWSAEVGNADGTVKNLLRVHNTGTVPWTGGLVFVTKEDTPLAQLEMPFTAGGKSADLEMANAQDILTKKEETEISRDTVPWPNRFKLLLPRALAEVHLSVESTRQETATFELTLMVPGDIVDPNGGKVEKLLTRPDQWNKYCRITWSFNLSPGDKREFRMQYHHVG